MQKSIPIFLWLIFLFQLPVFATPSLGNTKITSFSKAKRLLPKIFTNRNITFYCGCKYTGKTPNHTSCGYIPKKNNKRANRIEWEHVVPAHAFGQSFKSWREGDPKCVTKKGKPYKGRRCAKKMNKAFRLMEADLYNLVPAIGEINGLRSNYSFTMITGEPRIFGKCDFEILKRTVEPTESIRGDIARTYFYMNAANPKRGIISKKNRKLFKAWDKLDPVDEWECERVRRIERIQGNQNRFVADQC